MKLDVFPWNTNSIQETPINQFSFISTQEGHTALSIAQKLGYISVEESLKGVTETLIIAKGDGEKHKVVAPEIMQETFMSDSEDENGKSTILYFSN